MSEQPRDWDKELAEIDRLIAKAPAPPAKGTASPAPAAGGPRALPAPGGAPAPAAPRPGGSPFTAWLRVGLVLALGVALPFWPYAHRCGTALFLYLGAAGMLVLGGLWGAVTTWDRRMGRAHALSLVATLWGLALVAAEVLPRVGYAAQRLPWSCP